MTNQQYLSTISAEEWVRKIDWLYHEYGKRFTCSEPAIIEWLKGEYKENPIEDKDWQSIGGATPWFSAIDKVGDKE